MATQAERFEKCVTKVKKKVKTQKTKNPKGLSIAICTKAMLWPQGRTIRRFSTVSGKPKLVTQKRKIIPLDTSKK